MLRSVNSLRGCTLLATDGDIGEIAEFYFDDENWTIRYLVADTGGWLTGRKVLISPRALGKMNWSEQKLHVHMPKERIRNSPSVDTNKPVSRQHEMDLSDYYGYPYYWGGPYLWGPIAYPIAPIAPKQQTDSPPTMQKELRAAKQQQDDLHLRSTGEVSNYYIEAHDGDIGHVEDFLIDDETWTIRYLVIDTRNWLPGKKVIVSPKWIQSVSWNDSKVRVDLSRDAIKNAPEYQESASLNRDYEKQLHDHHHKAEYWAP